MIIASLEELLRTLASTQHTATPRALLLCGPDTFFLDAASELVRTHFADFSPYEFQGCDRDTLEESLLEESFFAPSLFVQKELFIFRSCEALKDATVDSILRYLQHPNPNSIVVFVSDTILKSASLYQELAKSHLVVHFAKMTPWEKQDKIARWIQQYVTSKGHTSKGRTIEPAASALLARSCNADFWALVHELDKLMTYVAEDALIDTHAIDALATLCEENTLWQLTDALYQQDAKTLLSRLANIQKDQVYPLVIIRHLRSSLSQTYNIASRISSHEPPDTIREHFPKIQGRLFEKAYNQARRYHAHQLRKSLVLLDKAQMLLKDAFEDETTLLQTLLLKLCHALHTA